MGVAQTLNGLSGDLKEGSRRSIGWKLEAQSFFGLIGYDEGSGSGDISRYDRAGNILYQGGDAQVGADYQKNADHYKEEREVFDRFVSGQPNCGE